MPVRSIFRLAGNDEDALTYGLGYLLALSPAFCSRLLRILGTGFRGFLGNDYSVHLQEVTGKGFGRRDVVIESGDIRVVLEAKVGGAEPTAEQLIMYGAEGEIWSSFQRRVVVALTQTELTAATVGEVRSELADRGIRFRQAQWHEVVDLLVGYRLEDEPAGVRLLFDEFIRYIRSDYNMGYYDAEVLVQDVNPLNQEIFKDGWMYVTSLGDKKAPLYFAPYFTGQGNNNGIEMIARVIDSEVVVLASKHDVLQAAPTEEHLEKWRNGLARIRKRAKCEGFDNRTVRLFYLDRPIRFRCTPLKKQVFKSGTTGKRIPSQIPKGFSLGFDDLIRP